MEYLDCLASHKVHDSVSNSPTIVSKSKPCLPGVGTSGRQAWQSDSSRYSYSQQGVLSSHKKMNMICDHGAAICTMVLQDGQGIQGSFRLRTLADLFDEEVVEDDLHITFALMQDVACYLNSIPA